MRKRDERERFARAVDREGSGAGGDEEFVAELAVVAALRELGASAGADSAARTRITERMSTPAVARPAPQQPSRSRRRLRPATVLASAAVLLVVAGGLIVSLSRDALPGDTLYDVKRAREEITLGLTFDREAEAFKRLDLAATRLTELGELAAADAGRDRYGAAMRRFHADATAGTALLVEAATSSGGTQLTTLHSWAEDQSRRLDALRPVLAGVAESGLDLLSRIGTRADALRERMDCYLITSGYSDELGPLPAAGDCSPTPEPGPPRNTVEQPPPASVVDVPPTKPPSVPAPDVPLPDSAARQATALEPTATTAPPEPELPASELPVPVPPVVDEATLPPVEPFTPEETPSTSLTTETTETTETTLLRLPLLPPVTIG